MRGPATVATCGLLATLLTVAPACGDETDSEPGARSPGGARSPPGARSPTVAPSRGEPKRPWSERLAEPSVTDLLAALHQSHATIRETAGPHRLHVVLDVELAPPVEPVDEDGVRALRPVDEPVVRPQAVHDELTLVWLDGDDDGAHLMLSQHNDHDRGRDVIVVDQTVHVRKEHREWFHYQRDGDVLERWLDDAQRSVHDAVGLAAPRLEIGATARAGGGLRGGDGVEITLDLADTADDGLVAAGPTQGWRRSASIEAIEGTLTLDAATGTWLSAQIDVRYRLPGADGRPLSGHLRLQATSEPDPSESVTAPPDSRPLPSRVRYEQEQRELLDGLAAP